MLRKLFGASLVVAVMALVPSFAKADFHAGNWELTLGGSGNANKGLTQGSFEINGSLGYFFTKDLEVSFPPEEPDIAVLLAPEKACEQEFVDCWRQWRRGGVDRRRVGADGDAHRHGLATFGHLAPVCRAYFVTLPVHGDRSRSEHLNPVHADVSNHTLRVTRDDHR